MIIYFKNEQTNDLNIFAVKNLEELKKLIEGYSTVEIYSPGKDKSFLGVTAYSVRKEDKDEV